MEEATTPVMSAYDYIVKCNEAKKKLDLLSPCPKCQLRGDDGPIDAPCTCCCQYHQRMNAWKPTPKAEPKLCRGCRQPEIQ